MPTKREYVRDRAGKFSNGGGLTDQAGRLVGGLLRARRTAVSPARQQRLSALTKKASARFARRSGK